MEIGDWRLGIRDWPRGVFRLPSVVCGLLLLLLLTACTSVDMARQPRVDPLEASDAFPHGQSARRPPEGAVSRQEAAEQTWVETGLEDGEPLEEMPVEIDDAMLERGAEQFNIFCAPCHDGAGTGNGAVVQRGYPQPPSFHDDRLRDAPDGHFFDVITNGFGHMYSYAPQTEPADRWAIIAHIRRLQESRQESE